MAWIIFAAIAVPILGILVWVILDDSVVRVPPGRLGLLLVRGAPTDTTLDPVVHWVPRLRRRMVVEYPALELSYRAGDAWPSGDADDQLERSGPALSAPLGDRTIVTVGYTVRFRLDVTMLRVIHTRFGTEGIWAAVRDESGRTLRDALGDSRFGIDDLFGPARRTMETELTEVMAAGLAPSGFVVTMFNLGDLDLGRAGDAIQATVRARLELQREEAEAAMRMARARIDAELAPYIDPATSAAALRYREVDDTEPEAAVVRSGRVVLVGSSGATGEESDAAGRLFRSDGFARAREHAVHSRLPWFVLSAKHGLLDPDDVISPFEVQIDDQSAAYRTAWGEWVVAQLADRVQLDGVTVEVHGGVDFAQPLRQPLTRRGAVLDIPLPGTWRESGSTRESSGPAGTPVRAALDRLRSLVGRHGSAS